MDISEFNGVLSFLSEAVLQRLDGDLNLTLKISGGGGPGENVDATIVFESICYTALPSVMHFSEYPQIVKCSLLEAKEVLPHEELGQAFELESSDGSLKTFRFYNGSKALSYCVVCYGYSLSIDPEDWDLDGWLQWKKERP